MKYELKIKGTSVCSRCPWSSGRTGPARRARRAGSLLLLLAPIEAALYYNYGAFHGPGYVHHWEQFHYVLRSKYFPEFGYDGLYAASLAAQRETLPDMGLLQPWVHDLRTNEVVSAHRVLADAQDLKQRFAPGRWRRFTADHDHFLGRMGWA